MYNDLYDEMIRKSEEARRKAYGEYYRDQNSKQKAYEDFYKNQERRRREFENIYKEYYQYQSPGYMRGNPRSDYSRKQQYHPHPYTSPFGNFLFTFIWLYIAIKILMSLVWSNGMLNFFPDLFFLLSNYSFIYHFSVTFIYEQIYYSNNMET